MARESVLTTAEKDAIKIEKLIFHIILKDQIAPIFLDKVIITETSKLVLVMQLKEDNMYLLRIHCFVLKLLRFFLLMMTTLFDYLKKLLISLSWLIPTIQVMGSSLSLLLQLVHESFYSW